MKKRISALLLCVLVLSLCACGTASPQTTQPQDTSAETAIDAETTAAPQTAPTDADVETTTEAPTEPETFIAATVSVLFADDSLPPEGKYDTFNTGTEPPQTRIVLSTSATVRDFKVLALTNGDADEQGDMHFDVRELRSFDRLTADRPLVVSTTFYGLIPNNGISYVDETGATRTFAIDMSGEDGSLYLWEFK